MLLLYILKNYKIMNEVTIKALTSWALFCATNSSLERAESILGKVFDKMLSDVYVEKFLDCGRDWNALVVSEMDEEDAQRLYEWVLDHA